MHHYHAITNVLYGRTADLRKALDPKAFMHVMWALDAGYGSTVTELTMDSALRIMLRADNTVEVTSLGIDKVDVAIENVYSSIDALPDWVQRRLAVLAMMDPTPPTTVVDGVGRRMSERIYWLFPVE